MYDSKTNAVLLLCSHFSSPKNDASSPLTPLEYGRLSKWLHEQGHSPEDLFLDFDKLLGGWVDPKGKITRERLRELFDRGVALALALEKWQRAGIWVVTRSDAEYPRRLKKQLGYSSPALFYGVGDKQLLRAGGIGIVGSRDIDESDKKYTYAIARQAAIEGLNVVSGGAKGVDETAMLGALSAEGTAIGVLADGLLKAAVSSRWRDYLMSKQLVLVSPFYPEARFFVGNAMARNKYIYCLSDYGLVVRSDEGKGGTWAGATENLKKQWVPLFVKSGSHAGGNAALVAQGASPLLIDVSDIGKTGSEPLRAALGMYQYKRNIESGNKTAVSELKPELAQEKETSDDSAREAVSDAVLKLAEEDGSVELATQSKVSVAELGPNAFYTVFVELLRLWFNKNNEVKLDDFKKDYPDIVPKQLTNWFDRADKEGLIERKGKRRIYTLKDASVQIEMDGFDVRNPGERDDSERSDSQSRTSVK